MSPGGAQHAWAWRHRAEAARGRARRAATTHLRVAGLISGTSHDAIDCAVVAFDYDGEETLRGTVLATAALPYPADVHRRLIAALPPARRGVEEVCRLDADLGRAFAEAARAVLAPLPDGGADLICSHGQTVFHGVRDGSVWGTLQLGQPAWIAEATGLPVVADLRSRDVAAGGQGAPLVCVLDQLVLADAEGPVAALNLGGIANATLLAPGSAPRAYDIGPANALIDAAAVRASGGRLAHDEDGRAAAAGRVDRTLLDALLADPYYRLPPPKTTGKEHFNAAYLEAHAGAGAVSGDDLVATATALTAETVAAALRAEDARRVVVSGGGVHNPTLMAWLAERLDGVELIRSDELGVPGDAKEAIAFALIGWLTAHGLPGALGSCTGAARDCVLGTIVPGAGPLALPKPLSAPPQRLILETAA